MKKNITIYFLMTLVCLGLQSCLFQEEDYFDDSSANRASADVKRCNELLEAAPNGWRMEYYIGSDYALGGITLLCKFDGQRVVMASQGYDGNETISSLYKVVSEEATMLTFDTYNEYIHAFGRPLGGGSNPNGNLQGDYEFIISEMSADRIVMRGKKYDNTIVMHAIPEDVNWESYINSVNEIEESAFFNRYQLLVDGNLSGAVQLSYYTFAIAYNDGGQVAQVQAPFHFTTDGFRFREPITLGGVSVQNFVWDEATETFTCTDTGATGVQLKGVYPEGYITYSEYIGEYELTCVMAHNGSGQLSNYVTTVELIQDVENKSYILKGLMFDLKVDYDRANGLAGFVSQKVNERADGYVVYTMFRSPNYFFIPVEGFGFDFIQSATEPGTFSWVDNGVFFTYTGGEAATMLYFYGFRGEPANNSTSDGFWAWYEPTSMVKQ